MTEWRQADARTPRPDGGRRMPGVPATRDDSASEAAASETCESAAAADTADDPVFDLTTAITFEALQAVADPQAVLADARSWSDWVGMVGEADLPTMNAVLRRKQLGVDFFNGGTEPDERLAQIAADEESPFREDRLVLVGLPDQEWIADGAGWEFEPLASTAERAGWVLERA